MIGGRKTRSNKGKKRGSYGPRSRTRSGSKFRNRKTNVNSSKKTRKQRSNKGKRRVPYGKRSRTRSGKKFRGGASMKETIQKMIDRIGR